MTEAEAIEALAQRWVDTWPTTPSSAVPFVFGTEPYVAIDTWVRVTFISTARRQATQGSAPNRRFEQKGYVAVQMNVPVGDGGKQLAVLAGSVRTVYESLRISEDLGTYAATPNPVPTDGRWDMSTITIPFWFDEHR
jgi:hypothetical protein